MTASTDPSTCLVLSPGAPLLANMAALWATDPALAAAMEPILAAEPYPVEPTRCEVPTVAVTTSDGRRIYLHSRHHPLDEARRLVDSGDPEGKLIFCVLGFGLGYHVEELLARAGEETVLLVAEPDLRLLRTAFERRDFSAAILERRLLLLTRPDRGELMLRLHDHQALVATGFAMLSHAPSVQAQGEFHAQVQAWMGQFVDFCRTSINTLVLNGQRTCENIARNLCWYVRAPGIERLRNRHAGQPAIIVSAGPSLRKNRRLLRDAAGKAVLIAVQTTLQPLLEEGVEPHYVTSLDYHDICTRFFERLPRTLRTELIAEPKASSAVLSLYPGPVSLLGNVFAESLLCEVGLQKPRLRAGATVAHLAFYLAEHLGCDPIIFVGQDLGFGDGLCYTPGTSYEDVWRPELGRFCTVEMKQWEQIVRERPILRRIEDWQGRPMYTEERLFAYLQQFERDFALSPARVIDATEGGARKRGATPMPLAKAIDQFCTSTLPPVPQDHPGLCDDLVEPCRESLRRRCGESARIESIARATLPLLEEALVHLADQERVNRIIARIDALRARMADLDDCYELVTQLTQKTQLERFRNDRRLASSRLDASERQRRQLARDIANVNGIIEAARRFQRLVDEVLSA